MKTFAGKSLLALDKFVAALVWRDTGITISSYCGLALRKKEPGFGNVILRNIGRGLNSLSPNHCEEAISGDIKGAVDVILFLQSPN
jgi:hypothetical protein